MLFSAFANDATVAALRLLLLVPLFESPLSLLSLFLAPLLCFLSPSALLLEPLLVSLNLHLLPHFLLLPDAFKHILLPVFLLLQKLFPFEHLLPHALYLELPSLFNSFSEELLCLFLLFF